MKNISPRVSDSTADYFTEHFKSVNAGATYILESYQPLFKRTLAELKGKFSHGEMSLVVDVFNGTALTSGLAGQHILLSCSDAIELDGLDTKWEIDKKELLEKIQGLTIYQAAVLEIWANGYWYSQGDMEDFNGYIGRLV